MGNDDDPDDLMDDFMSLDTPKRKYVAAKPTINVQAKKIKLEEVISHKREDKGDEYASRHRVKEEKKLATLSLNMPSTSRQSATNSDSDEEDQEGKVKEDPELPELEVFQRYQFALNPQELPILKRREKILDEINGNMVTVLTAATGTGKSSQVPQYILEEARKKNENCNIIVTQPRRIAAISIARRVALERRCDVGTLVGYQVGLDKQMDTKTNSDTRILFCTTGVLLQKLINEKTMKRYSHVILDEVHERDIDFDLLLVVVRRLLIEKNQYVKIILMSATLNAEKMANYFKLYDSEAPILNLEIPRPFKILITYLDQLEGARIGVNRTVINPEVPGISSAMYKIGLETIAMVTAKSRGKSNPSFLVFLPGIQEIKRFQALLYKPHEDFNIAEFDLTILHSSIPVENYGKAFDGTVENKIILATNIAESSVTLPGVRFVIDFCLTKYQLTDTATNMTQLKLDWASKMSLEQRAGRVGRIENGQVIRLIFKDHFMALPDETKPEIQRASLESVVLKTKILNMGKPSDILALALDPPKRSSIVDSILVLKELGGLTRMSKRNKFDSNDGELTFTGAVMGKLPVDVRISKLIVLGHVFSCLKECIIIGAALSSKSVFKFISPSIEHKIEEFQQRLENAKGSGSDLIATLNVYNNWRGAINRGLKGAAEKMWCDQQCLDLKNLRDMHDLVEDLKKRLLNFRLEESDDSVCYTREEKLFAIKICIGGAFYPHYYEFGGAPPTRDSYSVLNNMNPCTSVYLKGMEPKRLAQIYEQQVRCNLHEAGVAADINEMQVKFDSNSTRLLVQFKSISDEDVDFQPGEVRLEVYKAIKLGKLRRNMELNIMSYQDEIKYAERMELGTFKNQHFIWRKKMLKASSHCIYPKLYHREIPGQVTHIVNPGKFYFQPDKGRKNVEKHQTILAKGCKKLPDLKETIEGRRMLVKHEEVFKRGKIIDDEDEGKFKVYLIDYGEIVRVVRDDLYTCEGIDEQSRLKSLQLVFELPPQCIECRLSEIVPSPIRCASGWSEKSTEVFKSFIEGKGLEIVVHSFVDRIASVRLVAGPVTQDSCESVNEYLEILGFAQTSDDSYMNQLDNFERERQSNRNNRNVELVEDEFCDVGVIPPPEESLYDSIDIEGPFTPLESRPEMINREKFIDVVVEPSSVNHVLIDPYPNDATRKLLVSASMSEKDSRVTLHQTTIMPHLPGMLSLLGLLFSPAAEVHMTSKKDRYTSILCGLGADESQTPHFGEHDLLIKVDVELTHRDFEMINELREKMSTMLINVPGFKFQPKVNTVNKTTLRDNICQKLITLASKQRSPLGVIIPSATEWNWKPFVKSEDTVEVMYPQLAPVEKLMPMSENTREGKIKHAVDLDRLGKINAQDEIIDCRLCEERIETLVDLQLHVGKKLHRERLVRMRDETSDAY